MFPDKSIFWWKYHPPPNIIFNHDSKTDWKNGRQSWGHGLFCILGTAGTDRHSACLDNPSYSQIITQRKGVEGDFITSKSFDSANASNALRATYHQCSWKWWNVFTVLAKFWRIGKFLSSQKACHFIFLSSSFIDSIMQLLQRFSLDPSGSNAIKCYVYLTYIYSIHKKLLMVLFTLKVHHKQI